LAHTLAWRAHQQGGGHDASLLYLLARTQVLSGRAGGAIVTLERLARLGVATGVADDPDFAPVRALPDWPIVAAMFEKESGPIERTRVALTLPAGVAVSDLAWDGVSRRWLLASAGEPRVLVVGEGERVLSTLVGASANFGAPLAHLAIDTERGDLWVLSRPDGASGAASRLHQLQLISGRPLAAIEAETGRELVSVHPVGGGRVMAVARDGGLVRVDSRRRRAAGSPRGEDVVSAAAFSEALGGVLAASPRGLFRVDAATGRRAPITAANGFALDGLSGICANGRTAFVLQTGALGLRRVVQLHFDGQAAAPVPEIVDQNLADGSTPIACEVADGRLHYVARRDDGSYVIRVLGVGRGRGGGSP
jgi:hypothetical protein